MNLMSVSIYGMQPEVNGENMRKHLQEGTLMNTYFYKIFAVPTNPARLQADLYATKYDPGHNVGAVDEIVARQLNDCHDDPPVK